MNVLIDTNVVLDVLLDREPFVEQSARIVFLSEKSVIDGYISASAATDIFYIVKKAFQNKEQTYEAISKLFQTIKIATVSKEIIDSALELRWSDFEDGVQFAVACGIDADYIVTRNVSDFENDEIASITPADFLNLLGSSRA